MILFFSFTLFFAYLLFLLTAVAILTGPAGGDYHSVSVFYYSSAVIEATIALVYLRLDI